MPFFSIIIPTFNRAHKLKRAINSILNQTFRDFEIIVIDDGSTDNTGEVVNGIQDKRIRYYKKQNEERSIARNFGVERSGGEYINFLDSDDFFYSHHLKTAFHLLSKNDFPEVGHLGYEFVNVHNKSILKRNKLDEQVAERLMHENLLHGNAIFVRKDVIAKYHFVPSSDAVISEDWYLWVRLAARFKIHYDNAVTSAVLEHEERSLNNIDPDKLIASTNTIVEYLQQDHVFLKKYGEKTAFFFANHYTLVSLILANTKERKDETVKYLKKAWEYDWKVVFRKRFLASVKHLFLF
jgi:glycosyltransferase involved in cell wall biosynthesis